MNCLMYRSLCDAYSKLQLSFWPLIWKSGSVGAFLCPFALYFVKCSGVSDTLVLSSRISWLKSSLCLWCTEGRCASSVLPKCITYMPVIYGYFSLCCVLFSLPIELVGSSVHPDSSLDWRRYQCHQSNRTNDQESILQLLCYQSFINVLVTFVTSCYHTIDTSVGCAQSLKREQVFPSSEIRLGHSKLPARLLLLAGAHGHWRSCSCAEARSLFTMVRWGLLPQGVTALGDTQVWLQVMGPLTLAD